MGARKIAAYALEAAAELAIALGEPERAARLYGAAGTLREAIGCRRLPDEQKELEGIMSRARRELDERNFERARRDGAATATETVLAETLGWLGA